jgi:hypothetical protein
MIETGMALGRFCDVFGGVEGDAGFDPAGFRGKGLDVQRLIDDTRIRCFFFCRLNRGDA